MWQISGSCLWNLKPWTKMNLSQLPIFAVCWVLLCLRPIVIFLESCSFPSHFSPRHFMWWLLPSCLCLCNFALCCTCHRICVFSVVLYVPWSMEEWVRVLESLDGLVISDGCISNSDTISQGTSFYILFDKKKKRNFFFTVEWHVYVY